MPCLGFGVFPHYSLILASHRATLSPWPGFLQLCICTSWRWPGPEPVLRSSYRHHMYLIHTNAWKVAICKGWGQQE